jgi:hypothetical protein
MGVTYANVCGFKALFELSTVVFRRFSERTLRNLFYTHMGGATILAGK